MGDDDYTHRSEDGRFEFKMTGYEFAPYAHSGGTAYGMEIVALETGETVLDLPVSRWDVSGPTPVEGSPCVVQCLVRRSPLFNASSHVILGLDPRTLRFCVVQSRYPQIWREMLSLDQPGWRSDWESIEAALLDGIDATEAARHARLAALPAAPVQPSSPAVPHDAYDLNYHIVLKEAGGMTAGIPGLDPKLDALEEYQCACPDSSVRLIRVKSHDPEGEAFRQEMRDAASGEVLFTLAGGNWLVRDAAPNPSGVLALTPLEAQPEHCILFHPAQRVSARPGGSWNEAYGFANDYVPVEEQRSNMPSRRAIKVASRTVDQAGSEGGGYFLRPVPDPRVRLWEYRYCVSSGAPTFRQGFALYQNEVVIDPLPMGEWQVEMIHRSRREMVRLSQPGSTAWPAILIDVQRMVAAIEGEEGQSWDSGKVISERLKDWTPRAAPLRET